MADRKVPGAITSTQQHQHPMEWRWIDGEGVGGSLITGNNSDRGLMTDNLIIRNRCHVNNT